MGKKTPVTSSSRTFDSQMIAALEVCHQELGRFAETTPLGWNKKLLKALEPLQLFSNRMQVDDQLPIDADTLQALMDFITGFQQAADSLPVRDLLTLVRSERLQDVIHALMGWGAAVPQWQGAKLAALSSDLLHLHTRASEGANIRPNAITEALKNITIAMRQMVQAMRGEPVTM